MHEPAYIGLMSHSLPTGAKQQHGTISATHTHKHAHTGFCTYTRLRTAVPRSSLHDVITRSGAWQVLVLLLPFLPCNTFLTQIPCSKKMYFRFLRWHVIRIPHLCAPTIGPYHPNTPPTKQHRLPSDRNATGSYTTSSRLWQSNAVAAPDLGLGSACTSGQSVLPLYRRRACVNGWAI